MIEFSAQKPLAEGVVPSSGFKVVHETQNSPSKHLAIFEEKHMEECGMCAMTFSDANELFQHLKSHQAKEVVDDPFLSMARLKCERVSITK